MKIKILLLVLFIFASAFFIVSCGDEYDTPEGMQLIGGGEDKGYYFFAPEEWTSGRSMNGIDYVYVSRVDTTSVSFTEISPSSFNKLDTTKSDEDFFFDDYFEISKAEFPEGTAFGEKNGEPCLLGSGDTKADRAEKYTFNYISEDAYTGGNHKVAFMQILASHEGRFYVLTYSATLEKKTEDVTTYDYYLEKLQTVIDNIRFVEKKASEETKKEYPADFDGDILISDEELAGFTLYAPKDFEVDYSSAIVSATHQDGSNITMTKATATGTTINKYWEFRKTELDFYVDNITDITAPTEIALSNAKNAAMYEYTYEYNGKKFHVYQVCAVAGGLFADGYMFTYTALEENYSLHFDDITRILEKVEF